MTVEVPWQRLIAVFLWYQSMNVSGHVTVNYPSTTSEKYSSFLGSHTFHAMARSFASHPTIIMYISLANKPVIFHPLVDF